MQGYTRNYQSFQLPSFVIFFFKQVTCVPRRADASESRSFVDARSPVLARASLAGVVLVLTSDSGVVVGTGAVEPGPKVLAASVVHAGVADATFWRGLALFPIRS